jgi:ketosteroid isomerase-like protein
MSENNVGIANRGWEAWLRGDLDALAELWDSEVVWDVTHFRDWPAPAYFGIDRVKRFVTEWLEVWDDYEVGVDETLATRTGASYPWRGSAEKVAKAGLRWMWNGRRSIRFATARSPR